MKQYLLLLCAVPGPGLALPQPVGGSFDLPRAAAQADESIEWIPEEPPDEQPGPVPYDEAETARASAGPSKFTDRPVQIESRVGFGTTVGLLGLTGEYNVLDRLAVGAGAGVNHLGLAWGAHVRVRPIVGANSSGTRLHALTLEAAFSQGRYAGINVKVMPSMRECNANDTTGCSATVEPEYVSWIQLDAGWEMRAPSGFTLRLSYGVAALLNSPRWRCNLPDADTSCGLFTPSKLIPTFTVALGYAF